MDNLIKEQKMYESTFYPYGNNILVLPGRMRAYIDSNSYEFKYLTIEDKLCNLGFAVTRGMNLYAEIKQDISEHMKSLQYQSYEYNAKQSLFSYIDYLRESEVGLSQILFKQKDVDLMLLVDLFVEELLLRYNEYPNINTKEYIVNFVSIPIDYISISNRFNLQSINGRQLYSNYLLTSQESISKAIISKDYILYLNRWKELLPKLSQYEYLIPFSPDGFGNSYCFDTRIKTNQGFSNQIVFWQHDYEYSETDLPEITNNSLIDFINNWIIGNTLKYYDYEGNEKL